MARIPLPRFLPAQDSSRGWLYLLLRGDGLVKVGVTMRPHERFHQHRRIAERSGIALVRFHLLGSYEIEHARLLEARVIAHLARCFRPSPLSAEEFIGATFQAALVELRNSISTAPNYVPVEKLARRKRITDAQARLQCIQAFGIPCRADQTPAANRLLVRHGSIVQPDGAALQSLVMGPNKCEGSHD